jgi:hypothetical protein
MKPQYSNGKPSSYRESTVASLLGMCWHILKRKTSKLEMERNSEVSSAQWSADLAVHRQVLDILTKLIQTYK